MPRTAPPPRLSPPALSPDVAFLARRGIPQNVLDIAARLASLRGTHPRDELFACGFDQARYWSLLADDLGLPFVSRMEGARLCPNAAVIATGAVRLACSTLVFRAGKLVYVAAPDADEIRLLRERLRHNPLLAERVVIAAPETIRDFLVDKRKGALSRYAVGRLARVLPRFSARNVTTGRGARGPFALFAALLGTALLAPQAFFSAVFVLATLFFFNCALWRLAAAFRDLPRLRLEAIPSERLPTYTVLVPLYREAEVIPDLAARLAALDYPALCIKRTSTFYSPGKGLSREGARGVGRHHPCSRAMWRRYGRGPASIERCALYPRQRPLRAAPHRHRQDRHRTLFDDRRRTRLCIQLCTQNSTADLRRDGRW